MKKFFYSFFAAATLMFAATSCSQEEMIGNETSGNEVEVSFNVDMEGQQASRAIGDGTTAKDLYFGAYLKEGNAYTYLPTLQPTNSPTTGKIQFVDKKATVKLRLVKGQTYRFFFWAQSADAVNYYDVDLENHKVTMKLNDNNSAAANNEKRDAFYVMEEYTINGPLTETITLRRPFAQVNVGIPVGELAEAKLAGIDMTKSSFTFSNVATELDAFTGVASAEKKVLFYDVAIPESNKEDLEGDLKKVADTDYEYIAMNYIFANTTSSTVTDASFTVYTDRVAVNTFSVPNLTIQRNWRTNIIGSIMSDAEFNIVIDPIFFGDHNYPDTDNESLEFAALNGGEVTLTDDASLTAPLNVVADMVINMNGNKLTGSIKVAEGAHLTVNDGTIENTDENVSGIISNGTLRLNDVNITSARHALRIESGDAVINGGTYQVAPKSVKTLHALNAGDNGTTANVTIKNGTFIGPKGKGADSGSAVNVYNGSTVTIEGGNYSGGLNNTLAGKGKFVVTGGTFDQDPSAHVTSGYEAVADGSNYIVVPNIVASLANVTSPTNVAITDNVSVSGGTTIHTQNATADITINGNGNTIVSNPKSVGDFTWEGGTIPAMSTILSSENGSKVTVNDLSFTGTMSALMLGHYQNATYNNYNTELNNVNVINAKVVSFSANVAPAVCVYGTATLNNCNVYGTTLSELDTEMWPVYDLALVNYSTTTVNGGNIGSIFLWNQAALVVDKGAKVEKIVVRGNMNTSKWGITIKSGTTVNSIDLSAITTKTKVNITIETGATIGEIVANGTKYASIEEFKNSL